MDVTQVRQELLSLVKKYPSRKGTISDTDNDCVYYLDDNREPVDYYWPADYPEETERSLSIPVCIVGQWVDEFHPELKENTALRNHFMKNGVIGSFTDTSILPLEVIDLLSDVQMQQDGGVVWADIDLTEYQESE